MATVFMKWLETSPASYDRGIRLLTLGKIQAIKEKIAADYVEANTQVLEIGCGTGTLTCLMAQKGAQVSAIDASPGMLAEAKKKVEAAGLGKQVKLKYMDATLIGGHFKPASFDLIVSTLVFSELSPDERRTVLEACAGLLRPGGRIKPYPAWRIMSSTCHCLCSPGCSRAPARTPCRNPRPCSKTGHGAPARCKPTWRAAWYCWS
jgi:cyclopropane fatty-acyl-phospholipid synthase-like methyltransferase